MLIWHVAVMLKVDYYSQTSNMCKICHSFTIQNVIHMGNMSGLCGSLDYKKINLFIISYELIHFKK